MLTERLEFAGTLSGAETRCEFETQFPEAVRSSGCAKRRSIALMVGAAHPEVGSLAIPGEERGAGLFREDTPGIRELHKRKLQRAGL